MLDQNTLLLLLGFLVLVYLISNQKPAPAAAPVTVKVTEKAQLVDRTGADWNRSGALVGEVGLESARPEAPFTEESVKPKGTVAPWVPDEKGGPGYRDSYSQLKMQDEIYPNYYNKYEVHTSDYYPWWTNQHFWPYYTRSHNWMYRYPYYSSWRRPYYYNYWASPYYPSRTVLVKPYLRDMARKQVMKDKLAMDFRRAKINDSPRST